MQFHFNGLWSSIGTFKNRVDSHVIIAVIIATILIVSANAVFAGTNKENVSNGLTYSDVDVQLGNDSCVSGACYNSSSPTFADINLDGRLDIVTSTTNGHIVVTEWDGDIIWDVDVAPYFGMTTDKQEIRSSPAVADIDNDGFPEIVFGAGTIHTSVCTQGGVGVLNHLGQIEAGWPQFGADDVVRPVGCTDTIFGTPALGDLDNDGDMEVVVGGFDKRLYAWHHDGTLLPNFPPDSHMATALPEWQDLRGKFADTIWASPALADIDLDGYLDIILPTDEGYFGFLDDSGSWTCPQMSAEWAETYCGGALYVMNRHGQSLEGFPIYLHEAIQSSPVVVDINGDQKPEIILGTGTFYHQNALSPSNDAFRIHAFDNKGKRLPGWDNATSGDGGIVTHESMPASPSVGDITGDGNLEVVIPSYDGTIYALNADGSLVAGFPITPTNHHNNTGRYESNSTALLADIDGQPGMEIVLALGSTIAMVTGDGRMMTSRHWPGNTKPIYFADEPINNTPALIDLNNDGNFELIASGKRLHVWNLQGTGDESDWSSFRGDATRSGNKFSSPPDVFLDKASIELVIGLNDNDPVTHNINVTVPNSSQFGWTMTTPTRVTAAYSTGAVLQRRMRLPVQIDPSGLSAGVHQLGEITLIVTANPIDGSAPLTFTKSVPVQVTRAEVNRVFIPMLAK